MQIRIVEILTRKLVAAMRKAYVIALVVGLAFVGMFGLGLIFNSLTSSTKTSSSPTSDLTTVAAPPEGAPEPEPTVWESETASPTPVASPTPAPSLSPSISVAASPPAKANSCTPPGCANLYGHIKLASANAVREREVWQIRGAGSHADLDADTPDIHFALAGGQGKGNFSWDEESGVHWTHLFLIGQSGDVKAVRLDPRPGSYTVDAKGAVDFQADSKAARSKVTFGLDTYREMVVYGVLDASTAAGITINPAKPVLSA